MADRFNTWQIEAIAMTTAKDAALLRRFMAAELPLLPSQNPNRPGPVHIVNNFVCLALGVGSLHQPLAELISKSDSSQKAEYAKKVLSQPSTGADVDALSHFLDVIFDSDGNVYPSRSSALPLMPSVLGRDQSDDNYGLFLWRSLGSKSRAELSASLGRMVRQPSPNDGLLGRLGSVLENALGPGVQSQVQNVEGGTTFGNQIGQILLRGIDRSAACGGALRQLDGMRSLSVMLGFSVMLEMFHDSVSGQAEVRKQRNSVSPSDLLGMFVFCGDTPGPQADPLVSLAIRSLADQVIRSGHGINDLFVEKLQREMSASRRRSRKDQIRDAVVNIVPGDAGVTIATKLIEIDGQGNLEFACNEFLSANHLQLAIKSLGYKCGFSAPQRNGAPRLVLETSMLTALVRFFGDREMTSIEFSDRIHDEVGLIVGGPSQLGDIARERLMRISSNNIDIEEALQDNHEALNRRLVRSGLARQYSDGTTVIEDVYL